MANQLTFIPRALDPYQELQKRLAAAPRENAEALLVLWDLLAVSHRNGVLDMLVGAIGSKNAIAGRLAINAKEPVSTQAIRNGLTLATALGSVDPDMLARLVKAMTPSPTFFATSEGERADQQSENPVMGRPQTEDDARKREYEQRGSDAKPEAGRASVPHGENSAGSPGQPMLAARAARAGAKPDHDRAAEHDQPFDLSGEPPTFWQILRRLGGKQNRHNLRRALAYGVNTFSAASSAVRGE